MDEVVNGGDGFGDEEDDLKGFSLVYGLEGEYLSSMSLVKPITSCKD